MSDSAAASTIADERSAVARAPERISAAWAAGDGDAFAAACAEDATMILPGDVCLHGREEIRTFMTRAYTAQYKNTRVTGQPITMRFLGDDVSVLVTQGGVLLPGETEVAGERAIRATWVLVRKDGEWLISAYHNSPITAAGSTGPGGGDNA
ncbi:SgcJ/EcaC family oxidoreductase [Actinomadura fibrosa]|uniref:SgcJ/EcaC family oxidoreductase n=1 Tax=Actinomadura fibrosa TaxID=111802 RepID=A0ABW2Y7C3_9ACTN|nr:SgcJ/EcaC family oxidoreductase [Actinomadura fibrosa]